MILDTSAVVAVLAGEAEAPLLARLLVDGEDTVIGAATLVELSVVLQSRWPQRGMTDLRAFLDEFNVREIPFAVDQWRYAASGFAVYGRGRHPAALSLGDCFTYAAAKASGLPLLCVGNDFAQTDLELVPLEL